MAEYIDKEKLLNDIKCIDISECTDFYDIFTDVEITIDEQPTADVAEVRHGKWLTRYIHNRLSSGAKVRWDVKSCSICMHTQLCVSDYCPNCGAKMDKECEQE